MKKETYQLINKWDKRYLELARFIASWSKDPSTKVGSVIVSENNSIVSIGFNGFPRGVVDSEERLNDREIKYKLIVHAERNAIVFASKNLTNCTIYTWPFMPCSVCSGLIIQSGIKNVIAPFSDNPRWQGDFAISRQMLYEAGVDLVEVTDYQI